jgi:hypothetical protein
MGGGWAKEFSVVCGAATLSSRRLPSLEHDNGLGRRRWLWNKVQGLGPAGSPLGGLSYKFRQSPDEQAYPNNL